MRWLDITTRPEFAAAEASKRERVPAGILRITTAKPDPKLAYVIRSEKNGDLAQVPTVVRSVGQCGEKFYYAADLRFLHYDGFNAVWPVPGSDAYPVYFVELITDHTKTTARVMAKVKTLANDLHGCRECLAYFKKPGTDRAAIESAVEMARHFAQATGIKLQDIDKHPRRAEATAMGLRTTVVADEELNLEGGTP